VEGFDKVALFV